MPRTTIGLAIACGSQRGVSSAALFTRSRLVDNRAQKRMAEHDASFGDGHRSDVLGGLQGAPGEPPGGERRSNGPGLISGAGGGDQQCLPRPVWHECELPCKRLPEAGADR